MQKAAMLILLALCSACALAQTPAKKNKAVASKAAVKPVKSASEEATAAAQAAAIAQAAALRPAAAMPPASVTTTASPLPQPPQTLPPPTQIVHEQQAPLPSVASAQPSPAPEPAQVAHTIRSQAPAAPTPPQALPVVSRDQVSAEELAISQRVHQGHLQCEMGASVRVEHDAAQPGYFNLHGKGFRYRMRPVVTSTGAIRLEDAKAGAVWLQLANKSMLMDQKKGRRVADECAHPDQMAYAQTMKTNPPPKLFDTSGMGR